MPLFNSDRLTPVLDRVFPANEAAESPPVSGGEQQLRDDRPVLGRAWVPDEIPRSSRSAEAQEIPSASRMI